MQGQTTPRPKNWEAALSEAAFLTGLDRNADLVTMASYAPLFAHVDAWQWSPNLIWFDNLRSLGTPSYYVQKLFSTQRGTEILPVTINGSAKNGEQQLYVSALRYAPTNEVILKLVNPTAAAKAVQLKLAGAERITKAAQSFVIASEDVKVENRLDAPRRLAPVVTQVALKSPEFAHTLPPQSLTVLRVTLTK